MTTYLVFTRIATTDEDEMKLYAGKAGATLQGHPVTPLVAYGAHEILEGDDHEGMVVLAFPDKDSALGWYQSPDYQDARAHRLKGAIYQVTLTEGL